MAYRRRKGGFKKRGFKKGKRRKGYGKKTRRMYRGGIKL